MGVILSSDYDAWNAAIADAVFPELDYPQPVYLDLEGELLDAAGSVDGNPSRRR